MTNKIMINVENIPPAYDPGHSISNPKHKRHYYYRTLQEEALTAKGNQGLFYGGIKLEITYNIPLSGKRYDAANVIGGIANALEDVIYDKDKQINEINYKEILAEKHSYNIRITHYGLDPSLKVDAVLKENLK